jgi:pimeloyl-ACP methyl ester carboxylesterase
MLRSIRSSVQRAHARRQRTSLSGPQQRHSDSTGSTTREYRIEWLSRYSDQRNRGEDALNNNGVSRREFAAASAANVCLMASGQAAHANAESVAPVKYSRGLIESPPTYYEVVEPPGGSQKPPMVLISGGAHTGACYLATADGRPGWAHAFVRAGYKVVVPDWPGVGRSGYIPLGDLTGDVVVEGLGKVVASLGEPAIIMTHSMSGAYGWKLVENYGQHIAKVVAIAPGPPGNIQAVSEIVSETADTVVVRSSVTLAINLKQPVVSDRNFVEVKLVGQSTQFPREQIAVYASSLTPIPPRLLYQRRNVRGSQLKVADFSNFRGKRIVVVTGTADVDHPRKLDESIVEWLNQNGAKADFTYLGDRGIVGNGHMMMLEKNSDALAELVLSWIETG